ncbi:sporulation protein [Pseudonocardia sp. C8]|uniref:sporulation protein n=1 Tax=Pseudonocardia sp. C8 TaxID=2762759 RepID=UPI00164322FD|nr:sporulation protein [Pseudonocardia sp. C8]MBC3191603.1 sporulation protein [Pseudonocardia sp. C8]
MVFKKLKARFGGGTTVDTAVHTPVTQPGGFLDGVVEIVGGDVEQRIKYLALRLEVEVEVERDDREHRSTTSFAEQRVADRFELHPGERRSVPFRFEVPLQSPFNVVHGRDLPGVRLGLRTELDIAGSLDRGDLDPVRVEPIPPQQRLLAAFEQAGCHFLRADVEQGHIPGAQFGFYQEIEFAPPRDLRGLKEVEVSFLAGPHAIDVLIQGDRRGGFLDAGGDRVARLTIPYDQLDRHDWASEMRGHLGELARRRGLFG